MTDYPLMKKGLFSSSSYLGTRRSTVFCFTFTFIAFTILFVFNHHSNTHTILKNLSHDSVGRSQVVRFPFSRRTSTSQNQEMGLNNPNVTVSKEKYEIGRKASSSQNQEMGLNNPNVTVSKEKYEIGRKTNSSQNQELSLNKPNVTVSKEKDGIFRKTNSSRNREMGLNGTTKGTTVVASSKNGNKTGLLKKKHGRGGAKGKNRKVNWFKLMRYCDLFDGTWVKDDSYPLYDAGSCPFIDEPFDCFHNGRPDNGYENFRWQPKGCNIPRLNSRDFLELLRGKRLVYVGDSLNRNMWESMLCTLRNSAKDKSKVYEASGRQEFRTDGSYAFLFSDYNCSVEFYRSTFLVQEWEMPDTNGLKKETLRLDLIERSSDRYKNADILVFNTGHWWTHEKTSEGKGYYQEGSHVYSQLDVVEAFRKAMTTWARWVDANVNPSKTLVFFRGYSASHFSGGQWNSGGQCDNETEPITSEAYLSESLPIMNMLEKVIKQMKTPVFYLNVTKMTDFRKDAHPSIYRKQNLTGEERRSPLRFQDCSHWCLPGVPETWNELVYAHVLATHYQKQLQQQNRSRQQQKRP